MVTARQLAEALANTGQGQNFGQYREELHWEDMTPEAQDQAVQTAEKVLAYVIEKQRTWAA